MWGYRRTQLRDNTIVVGRVCYFQEQPWCYTLVRFSQLTAAIQQEADEVPMLFVQDFIDKK